MLILLLAVFLLAESGFCWVSSFRHSASGNLLWGDLDNDVDPVYIWDNQGYRLYTTLSNLSSSNDEYFSNSSDGVYLFGMSGNFGMPPIGGWDSRTMFLIQLADTRYDNISGLDTDFNGLIDVAGEGEMSGDFAEYIDIDNDNIYDSREIVASTADNFDLFKARDWHITQGFMKGLKRAGFYISHLGYGTNYRENNRTSGLFSYVAPDHTFSYSKNLVFTDLGTGTVIEERAETGDFKSTFKTPANIIKISYQAPIPILPPSDLRLDFTYNKSIVEYEVTDILDFYRDVSVAPDVDITNYTETAEVDSTLNGSLITPGAQLTRHWTGDIYSWFAVEIGFGSFDADRTFRDNYVEGISNTNPAGDLEVETSDFNQSSIRSGETDRTVLRLYHKTVVDFTQKFKFAIGADYRKQTDKTDWNEAYNLNNQGSFTIFDGVDDANDSTFISTSSFDTDFTNEIKTTTINLPVSMEYRLGRWTFRIGAVHTILKRKTDEDRQISDAEALLTIVDYGDGTADTTLSDLSYLSLGSAGETRQHFNNFVYGLEFQPNKNLRIELLEFLGNGFTEFIDTEFYRQLRLSFTVIF
jgi:hypothetical protein